MTATRVLNGVEQRPGYCGRATMASTAEGYGAVHDAQQKHIIDVALSDELSALPFGALACLIYTSPSPRDRGCCRMPSSA